MEGGDYRDTSTEKESCKKMQIFKNRLAHWITSFSVSYSEEFLHLKIILGLLYQKNNNDLVFRFPYVEVVWTSSLSSWAIFLVSRKWWESKKCFVNPKMKFEEEKRRGREKLWMLKCDLWMIDFREWRGCWELRRRWHRAKHIFQTAVMLSRSSEMDIHQ